MTSIEWLAEQLLNAEPNVLEWQKYILQAKEMHKKEIIDAYNKSFELRDKPYSTADKYYQEIFISKGSDDHIVDTNEMVQLPQQEISDEEIEKFIEENYKPNYIRIFVWEGIKWYREQLKQRQ